MSRLRAIEQVAISVGLALWCASHARAQNNADQYQFSERHGQALALALRGVESGAELSLTGAAPAWDTALLGVDLQAQTKDPWLELEAGAAKIAQHVDPEANGLRWLNLTGLRAQLTEGATLSLRGHGVRVRGTTATLRRFETPELKRGPILVLAPHPDDAEIAAFGLYAAHAERVSVVTVTCGNSGDANYAAQFGADEAGQYAFKGYLRAVDSVTVPWQGGVPPERCANLGYFDARLAEMHAEPAKVLPEAHGPNQDVALYRKANLGHWLPSASRTSTWQHLVEDLASLFRKLKPSVVITPHPRLDTHLDHQFVTVAAAEAMARVQSRPTFLLYTNHASADRYPFGPAGSAMTLPPWAGPWLSVQRILSLPVSPELQRRKLFALESMHDLRLGPGEQGACNAASAPAPGDSRANGSGYFRRAVRSEETFFVLDHQGLQQLVREFLAARPK